MTIQSLLDNARRLQSEMQGGILVRDVLMQHGDDIVTQQRIQLMMGKASDGKDLRPYYSEDLKPRGYFKSGASAKAYAAWKQTLNYPYNVERNPDAPNLYITGMFHDDLGIAFGGDSVEIVPDTAYAAKIMAKYGRGVFGLNASGWAVIWDDYHAKDELITKMKETLWQ